MADTTDNIHHMMERLTIASQGHARTSTLYRIGVEDAKMSLVQAIEKTMAQAREVRALVMKDSDGFSQKVAVISAFRKGASELENLLRLFNDASKNYIVAYLLSVGEKTFSIQQLLSHFKNKIKDIVHSVLANTTHDRLVHYEVCSKRMLQAIAGSQ